MMFTHQACTTCLPGIFLHARHVLDVDSLLATWHGHVANKAWPCLRWDYFELLQICSHTLLYAVARQFGSIMRAPSWLWWNYALKHFGCGSSTSMCPLWHYTNHEHDMIKIGKDIRPKYNTSFITMFCMHNFYESHARHVLVSYYSYVFACKQHTLDGMSHSSCMACSCFKILMAHGMAIVRHAWHASFQIDIPNCNGSLLLDLSIHIICSDDGYDPFHFLDQGGFYLILTHPDLFDFWINFRSSTMTQSDPTQTQYTIRM